MGAHTNISDHQSDWIKEQQRLLLSLAEQLKLSLLQIERTAEVAKLTNDQTSFDQVSTLSDIGLQLVEQYTLSLRTEAQLDIEPVSLAAVLHKTAHRLHKLAQLYNCDLELVIGRQVPLALANANQLEAAFTSLGSVLIEAQSSSRNSERPLVTLAAHKNRWGLVAGFYGRSLNFNASNFQRGKSLYGRARQPLNQLVGSAGSGIFLADSLLRAMSLSLRPARYNRLSGLAATLPTSQQLMII